MASVRFESVSKNYGATQALDGFDLSIADGEFVVVLGPSRSGKSTILRLAAGLEAPASGTISFDEHDVTALPPRQRDVGMFFQNYALYPNRNGWQNIEASLRGRGASRAEARARVSEVAELLGVTHLLDRRPATYSGGEQQRVAIGRALARRAGLCLFDEPLSNLDALVRLRLRTEFKRIQHELGVTMLYVTPDQLEAMALADRIVVLRAGRVAQIGTPDELYARPATSFVAGFLGSPPMNVLPGELIRNGDGVVFRAAGGAAITVRGDFPSQLPLEHPIVLGVRPEHLALDEGGPHTIAALESVGRRKLAHLDAGDHQCRAIVPVATRCGEGASVAMSCDAAAVHVFSASGSERLN